MYLVLLMETFLWKAISGFWVKCVYVHFVSETFLWKSLGGAEMQRSATFPKCVLFVWKARICCHSASALRTMKIMMTMSINQRLGVDASGCVVCWTNQNGDNDDKDRVVAAYWNKYNFENKHQLMNIKSVNLRLGVGVSVWWQPVETNISLKRLPAVEAAHSCSLLFHPQNSVSLPFKC